MLFHKKTFIFAPENEMWKDLSSLQPQKKMLKNTLTFLFTFIYSDNFPRWLTN